MRMRTIAEVTSFFQSEDPQTAITKSMIRRLVVSGALPSVRIGTKYLVSIEAVECFLKGEEPHQVAEEPRGVVRKVPTVL